MIFTAPEDGGSALLLSCAGADLICMGNMRAAAHEYMEMKKEDADETSTETEKAADLLLSDRAGSPVSA